MRRANLREQSDVTTATRLPSRARALYFSAPALVVELVDTLS
jgi:hypothetical protein